MQRWLYLIAFVPLAGWPGLELEAQSPGTGYVPDPCIDTAYAQYYAASRQLKAPTPILSLEALLLQRRLQEDYCQRVTTCAESKIKETSPAIRSSIFSLCLQRETLFEYDAVLRK